MRLLPSGSTALLVELDDLDEVLALHAALAEERPDGVVDVVPAARTVLVVIDPARTSLPPCFSVMPIPASRPRLVDGVRRPGSYTRLVSSGSYCAASSGDVRSAGTTA